MVLLRFTKLIELIFGKSTALALDEYDKEIKKRIEENEAKINHLKMRLAVLNAMQRLCRKSLEAQK